MIEQIVAWAIFLAILVGMLYGLWKSIAYLYEEEDE